MDPSKYLRAQEKFSFDFIKISLKALSYSIINSGGLRAFLVEKVLNNLITLLLNPVVIKLPAEWYGAWRRTRLSYMDTGHSLNAIAISHCCL